MTIIKLTKDREAVIDDCDARIISYHRWCASRATDKSKYYAYAKKVIAKKEIPIYMHRVIMGAILGIPTEVVPEIDHIDGNGLNNLRCNLRIATRSQNSMNRGLGRNNKSGFKGVWWEKRRHKWYSAIGVNNKRIFVGYFDNVEDAAKSYDKRARQLFGIYARLNFPEGQ